MFFSLTLATLAVLMGSRYSQKIKNTISHEEDLSKSTDPYKLDTIPLAVKEIEAYNNLCLIVSKDKSINPFNLQIKEIERILLTLHVFRDSTGPTVRTEILIGRFKEFVNYEQLKKLNDQFDKQSVLSKLEKLKEYVELLFYKTRHFIFT